jgi:uncharacterized membrane protein
MNDIKHTGFDTADITALSHLYRGEVYRSTVWRTRLDTTTNWAVVTTGLALSMTAAKRLRRCRWCWSACWSLYFS